jgi:hypothetical protein
MRNVLVWWIGVFVFMVFVLAPAVKYSLMP